jgi:methyltransferase (TIGR00027 family)
MVDHRPSFSAAWVAACRTLGAKLPAGARLCDDPYGAWFAGRRAALLARALPRVATRPFWPFARYMQVRTRVIDDALRAFVREGGRQVLLLGAGYDARATRLASELDGARVFEVDHAATQARKRHILARLEKAARRIASAAPTYLAWDFETRPLAELPGALAAVGHDARRPTLVIWEGVTMYLTVPAIEASFAALRDLPASRVVLTYFDKKRLEAPRPTHVIMSKIAGRSGEPFRFGWDPAEFPAWVERRGFHVAWDKGVQTHAAELLPPAHARKVPMAQSHIALLERIAEDAG